MTQRYALFACLAFAVACDSPFAPPEQVEPVIATITASPDEGYFGTSRDIQWSWTYANEPYPEPTCSLDYPIGELENGEIVPTWVNGDKIFTLTCTNSAGTHAKEYELRAARVEPVFTSFIATPASVPSGVDTVVTWTWTLAPAVFPSPTCVIDEGVGDVQNADTSTVNLQAATVYTLQCSNEAGTHSDQVTITIE